MLFDDRPRLLPTAVMGRVLRCTRPDCGKLIDLVEIPVRDVDPDTYVCLDHFQPIEGTRNIPVNISPPEIREPPAPRQPLDAAQIRDWHTTTFGNAA